MLTIVVTDNWYGSDCSEVEILPLGSFSNAHVPFPTTVWLHLHDLRSLHDLSDSVTTYDADCPHFRRHTNCLRNQ